MRNVTILLAVAAVVAMAVPASGAVVQVNTFIGGHGPTGNVNDWNTAANWDRNRVPGDDPANYLDKVNMAASTIADVKAPWIRTSGLHNLYLGLGGGGGTVNIAADFQSPATIYVGYGASSTKAFVNQTAGTVKSSGSHIYVDTDSVYTIYGGKIDDVNSTVITMHTQRGGEFKVIGDTAGINLKNCIQDADSLTTFKLTAAGTVSTIFVVGNQNGAWGVMTGDLTIDDSLYLNPTLGDELVLFEGTATSSWGRGIIHSYTSTNSNWILSYRDKEIAGVTVHNEIIATYVPEPATMVLLGIGGLGVLLRRKRR